MDRKDYHLYTYINNYILKEGKMDSRLHHGPKYMEIQLTDEEASKYDRNKILNILKKYIEITKKRSMFTPKELLLYAIEQCIFGEENEHNQSL